MRIGLAGIPGSGKTALAEALKNNEEFKQLFDNDIVIVDGYVEEIEKETDLAQGFFGTYIGNIHVALGREYRERIAAENHKSVITCGTLFETSAYLAQKMELEFSILSTEEEKYDWNLRVDAAMRMIACLYVDTMRFDKIYHLSPLEVSDDENFVSLEKNLQAAFNAFKIFPVKRLSAEGIKMEEITNKRVNMILEDIKSANNNQEQKLQTEEPNGSGIRSSEQTGEEQATS